MRLSLCDFQTSGASLSVEVLKSIQNGLFGSQTSWEVAHCYSGISTQLWELFSLMFCLCQLVFQNGSAAAGVPGAESYSANSQQ